MQRFGPFIRAPLHSFRIETPEVGPTWALGGSRQREGIESEAAFSGCGQDIAAARKKSKQERGEADKKGEGTITIAAGGGATTPDSEEGFTKKREKSVKKKKKKVIKETNAV